MRRPRFLVGHLGALLALWQVCPSADRGQKIDDERKDVAGENKGDHPFEDGAGVLFCLAGATHANAETDGKAHLDNHEAELDKEAGQQDTVLRAIENAQSKILGANENGTDQVSDTTPIR